MSMRSNYVSNFAATSESLGATAVAAGSNVAVGSCGAIAPSGIFKPGPHKFGKTGFAGSLGKLSDGNVTQLAPGPAGISKETLDKLVNNILRNLAGSLAGKGTSSNVPAQG